MNDKIQLLDLAIDNYTAKDAMKLVIEYLNKEQLNVVEFITLSTLGKIQNQEELQRQISQFDITFAGDKAILEAAGIKDDWRLQQAEPILFVKMVMRYLHKNKVRVFLLAEKESSMNRLKEILGAGYDGIQIVGSATMEAQVSDDMLLNQVNGVETDCILSTLSSPLQEEFIIRNKTLLHAKLWLGLGIMLNKMTESESFVQKIKKIMIRRILKQQIEQTKVVNNDKEKSEIKNIES